MRRAFFTAFFLILLLSRPVRAAAQTSPHGTNLWNHYSLFTIVRSLAFEGDLLWAGTHNGVMRYDTVREEQQVYNTRNGLLSNIVHTVVVDPKGNKWVGTYGGGLSRFDGKSWTAFTPYGAEIGRAHV